MKKSFLLLLLAVLVFAFGCGPKTLSITDVKTCVEMDGEQCPSDQEIFPGDIEIVYATAKIKNVQKGTVITFSWYDISGGESVLIGSVDLDTAKSGSGDVYSDLSAPPTGFPAGEYEVVITVNVEDFVPIHKKITVK